MEISNVQPQGVAPAETFAALSLVNGYTTSDPTADEVVENAHEIGKVVPVECMARAPAVLQQEASDDAVQSPSPPKKTAERKKVKRDNEDELLETAMVAASIETDILLDYSKSADVLR